MVSVIIPTLETRGDLLERAIRSVQKQTYPCIEIIPIFGHPVSKSRNIGITKSRGAYIAFLDDDDEWHPHKIEEQMNELLNDIYCPLCITYAHDCRLGKSVITKPSRHITHEALIKSFNLAPTSTFVVPRYFLTKLKKTDGYYFDETFTYSEDYDLAIRLTRFGSVRTVEKILTTLHHSGINSSFQVRIKLSGVLSIFKKYHSFYSPVDYVKTIALLSLIVSSCLFGRKSYQVIIQLKKIYEK